MILSVSAPPARPGEPSRPHVPRSGLIATVCLLAALLGACGAPQRPSVPASTEAGAVPLLLVSIDGFHPDYLEFAEAPTLRQLAQSGALARTLQPAYPSLTFPNHYSQVTGLEPDSHGIIDNRMRDPKLGAFTLHDPEAVADPRWWGGEPVWLSAQRQGLRAATLFWPGSEAPIGGRHPDDWLAYDPKLDAKQRVRQVLAWLERPPSRRPHLLTLYFEKVDSAGHDHGPGSAEVRAAVAEVDAAMAQLLAGIEALGPGLAVNLVVVSDHGMAPLDTRDPIVLSELFPLDAAEASEPAALVGVYPKPGREREVEQALLRPHARMSCHRREDMPARWRYGTHPRVPPILCQAVPPYVIALALPAQRPARAKLGGHGYDPALAEMRALFIGHGPAFRPGARLERADAVDVYPLLCRLLGIEAAPNQGNPQAFDAVLKARG